jgi:mannan endo-1,4-beta-mannosidase
MGIFRIVKCLVLLFTGGLVLSGCNASSGQSAMENTMVDANATAETRALFRNLKNISARHILFGHQDALAYGVGRRHDGMEFSDVKDVAGAYPAVYGWDIGHIAHETNIDSVPFSQIVNFIKEGYRRGGVITISWHEMKPGPDKKIWSQEPKPSKMLPGGEMHNEFKEKLKLVGNFFYQLKDANGRPIPVIFRPFHEHNGDWFWWGTQNATPQEYIDLWRFTVDYLKDTLKINHLLYAISPDRSRMATADRHEDFLYAYPGDEYVDIIGLDNYWDVGRSFVHNSICRETEDSLFLLSLKTLVQIAESKNKIPALTETGLNMLTEPDWFTERILKPIKDDSVAIRIAYILVWRNAWHSHFYTPFPGHPAVPDFMEFYQDDLVLFENELPPMYQ